MKKGIILNILEMPPQTEQTFPSYGPAKFALEMNAGWFTKNGLKAGDVVDGVLSLPQSKLINFRLRRFDQPKMGSRK